MGRRKWTIQTLEDVELTKPVTGCTEKVRETEKFQATLRFSLSPVRGIEISFTNTGEMGWREGTNWKWKLTYLGQTSCRNETETREMLGLMILSRRIPDKITAHGEK